MSSISTITPDLDAALRATRFQPMDSVRGTYGELKSISGPMSVKAILDYVRPALPGEFCAFDFQGRGDALSLDLYGWCPDERVAVVQVRQAFRQRASHYMNVRKTYVLCGYNEGGEPFRHPVSAHAVRAAVNSGAEPVEVVRAAQRWMWGVTAQQLRGAVRQGDVLIVAERGAPKGALIERGTEARLAESHVVQAERIVTDERGRLWAVRPTLVHAKGQHRPETAPLSNGIWFTVRVADEAAAWDFSTRMGD